MSSDQKSSDQMNSDQMNLDLWSILIKTKQVVSQLPFARTLLVCVCGLGRVSCAVEYTCHMPGRTTRKCKETLLQVRERLQREQANRTSKRIRELLGSGHSDSESESSECLS